MLIAPFLGSSLSPQQLARRRLLATAAFLPAACWLGPARAAQGDLTEFTFTMGVNTVPGTALIDATAQDLGLWRKHGLKPVVPPPLGGGDRRTWSPGEENHSDVRLYGMGATINYLSKGVDFVIVADLGTRAEWHMWSMADRPVDARQLKGKRFAVTQLSGTDRLYVDLFLKSLGVSQDDVTLVPTGGVPQNYQALRSGQADIWVTTEHAAILIDREQRLQSVARISDFVGKDWDPYVIVAKRRTLAERPALVKEAVATILEAVRHIDQAPRQENVARLMQRFKVDEAVAGRLLSTVSLNPTGKIKLSTIEKMRNHYVDTGVIKRDALPIDAIFDASVVGTVA